MPCFQHRFAICIWYVCMQECLRNEEAFQRLVQWRIIGGQNLEERLAACGENDAEKRLTWASDY